MSRLYETLRRMEMQRGKADSTAVSPQQPVDLVHTAMAYPDEMAQVRNADVEISAKARLIAATDPRGLPAEKFRALVTRLENQRKERELKSLQVTSAVGKEGKSLISANLAITLAKHTGSRVLLIEGDLHRPTLCSLLGLGHVEGIGEWWSAREEKERISNYVCRLNQLSLWFLSAGVMTDHPSQVLQSARFAETFARLTVSFDWVVVDSAPILPVIDTNLWSRMVDGSLLVVREGVTPLHALKKAFENLDNPKLIGVVLNEASEFDRINYADQYYAVDRS
jgi:protein-tyrosine kinase